MGKIYKSISQSAISADTTISMKVLLITNELPHHYYLCNELADQFDLTIVHPRKKVPIQGRVTRILKRIGRYGWLYAFLSRGGSFKSKRWGWPVQLDYSASERYYFQDEEARYRRIDSERIHILDTVNGAAGLRLLEVVKPDVVVNLGGDIIKPEFLAACPIVLNFHSGISPIYNGSGTINFAFSNGHLHLCGGTLMLLNQVIDGGQILAHVFPKIESEDTPGRLFMKTIKAGTSVIIQFIDMLRVKRSFSSIKQATPIFYYKGIDWTVYQRLKITQHIDNGVPEKFVREARVQRYWDHPDSKAAELAFYADMQTVLFSHNEISD
ncbi:MAG: hypothetical protein ACI9BD_001509 [Candidatus Marinamargulisbacteria bacterium]